MSRVQKAFTDRDIETAQQRQQRVRPNTLLWPMRALALLALAAVAMGAPVPMCHATDSLYDMDSPTGLFLHWNSSSGASGQIQYDVAVDSWSVPDENGSGGMRRRVVLAEGDLNCTPLPQLTTSFRGQQAGVPFRNTFVMYLMTKSGRTCTWREGVAPSREAGAAGMITM